MSLKNTMRQSRKYDTCTLEIFFLTVEAPFVKRVEEKTDENCRVASSCEKNSAGVRLLVA